MLTEDYRDSDHKSIPVKQIAEFMVARDKFMSGWGRSPGNSYVAYDLTGLTSEQTDKLTAWMQKRGDYKNIRNSKELPRGKAGDHLAIYTPPAYVINA